MLLVHNKVINDVLFILLLLIIFSTHCNHHTIHGYNSVYYESGNSSNVSFKRTNGIELNHSGTEALSIQLGSCTLSHHHDATDLIVRLAHPASFRRFTSNYIAFFSIAHFYLSYLYTNHTSSELLLVLHCF